MADMTAMVLQGHGGTDMLQLRDDWPRLEPACDEVLVRVSASAVNNTDIWTRQGAYGLPGDPHARAGWRGPIDFPRVQGGDITGVIAGVGSDVDAARIGRRVVVDPAVYRDETADAAPIGLLGSEADGGFAQFVSARANQAHDVTGSPLSDEQLAALPVAYGTAMGMLERGQVAAGETVLVTGASGGVGLALVQLASARGAHVVAVTSGDKADQVIEAGAAHTVDRRGGDLASRLGDYSGIDAVCDVVGGAMVAGLMPYVRDDGRWIVAGAIGGPVVDFDLRRLYLHNISLIGSSMHTRRHFAALVDVARTAGVMPVVAARFPLGELAAAQEALSANRYVGKIAIEVD